MATNSNREDDGTKLGENRPIQESPKEPDDDEKIFILPVGKEINVAVSSRALFELEEENDVYERKGRKEYIDLQISREDQPLKPGAAFPFIKEGPRVCEREVERDPHEKEIFSITLMSHNSGQVCIRLQNSIEHHGLNITGLALTSGANIVPYLKPYEINLFLTSFEEEVAEALKEGFAAAVMSLQPMNSPSETQLRIAFDLDVVLFADENKEDDEYAQQDASLNESPLKKFAEAIGRMQKKLITVEPCPIRTYIISSRSAKIGRRAQITLRNWGLEIDESHFKEGLPTDKLLKIINPHIYFNNKDADVESARAKGTPTGYVKGGEHSHDEKKKEDVKKDLFKSKEPL
ncbi:cytosolic 5'-nucleotidase 1A-like [Actinia tenebrosa]|uniref:Cytosolic 5'-nucleotidase 1A-like n=1 Tax=Actinia tenebrosa TaxID=6105 RepID=A0A6P8IRS7_ACTTE|nr:cytosolic 5'-nucleotidase 1A-like [Actinia tenebrosa]